MAASKTSEPTNSRVLEKALALVCCEDAMKRTVWAICGSRTEYQIPLPEGEVTLPKGLLQSLGTGASVIGYASVGGDARRRVAIVRLSVGMLTTSMVGNTATEMQKAAFQIEHVESIGGQSVSKAKLDVAPINAKQTLKSYVEIANKAESKAVAKVAGESIKSLSKVVAHATVAFAIIDAIMQINAELGGENDTKRLAQRKRDCCSVVGDAAKAAFKKAPEIFHRVSLKTLDKSRRAYGRRTARN